MRYQYTTYTFPSYSVQQQHFRNTKTQFNVPVRVKLFYEILPATHFRLCPLGTTSYPRILLLFNIPCQTNVEHPYGFEMIVHVT